MRPASVVRRVGDRTPAECWREHAEEPEERPAARARRGARARRTRERTPSRALRSWCPRDGEHGYYPGRPRSSGAKQRRRRAEPEPGTRLGRVCDKQRALGRSVGTQRALGRSVVPEQAAGRVAASQDNAAPGITVEGPMPGPEHVLPGSATHAPGSAPHVHWQPGNSARQSAARP